MVEEINQSLLIDFDDDDCCNESSSLGLLNSPYFDNSYLNVSDNKLTQNETHTHPLSNGISEGRVVDCKALYENEIKPLCPNLEYSYSELFNDNKPKGPEFIKAFVAARIAKTVKKVTVKSFIGFSFLNLSATDLSPDKSPLSDSQQILKCRADLEALNKSLADYEFKKNVNENCINHHHHHLSFWGSVEVLNNPLCNNGTFTEEEQKPYQYNKLKKSFSFSGFTEKDIALDGEISWEDSVPSMDEKDEFGLPINRMYIPNMPSKKENDLSYTLAKYKRIVRATFSESSQLQEVNADEEAPVKLGRNVDTLPAPPALPEVPDIDTQLKKKQVKAKPVTTKGPMKALVPLQNMSKQMGLKILSPFKKKKEKKKNISVQNSSLDVEIFEEMAPIASSTPTSDGRPTRRESTNKASRRSYSEGKTPVKTKTSQNKNDPFSIKSTPADDAQQNRSHLNVTKTIEPATCDNEIDSTKIIAPKSNCGAIPKIAKPKSGGNACLRRPSTAPANPRVSIKAPLPNLFSGNQPYSKHTAPPKLSGIFKKQTKPVLPKLNNPPRMSSALSPTSNPQRTTRSPNIIPEPKQATDRQLSKLRRPMTSLPGK